MLQQSDMSSKYKDFVLVGNVSDLLRLVQRSDWGIKFNSRKDGQTDTECCNIMSVRL